MEHMYVVLAMCGCYSEKQVWTVCACDTEERADEVVSALDSIEEFNKAFQKRVETEFTKTYVNPVPKATMPERPMPSPEFRMYTAACANGMGTPEQKQMVRKLQAEHIQVKKAWQAQVDIATAHNNSRWVRLEQDRQTWIDENYKLPDNLASMAKYGKFKYGRYDDIHYFIKKVDVV